MASGLRLRVELEKQTYTKYFPFFHIELFT